MAHRNGSEPSAREKSSIDRRRHWVRLIAEQEKTGMSQVDFCRDRQVSVQTFRWWKSRLNGEGSSEIRTPRQRARRKRANGRPDSEAALIPVTLTGSGAAPASGIEIVVAGGRVIRVPGPFSDTLLHQVISAVESVPCSR
jgi:hypothetical protein